MPERIQQSRAAGWRKGDNTVCCSRPSRYGNPFKVVRLDADRWQVVGDAVGADTSFKVAAMWATRELATHGAVFYHRVALLGGCLKVTVDDVRRDLCGKDLACFCPLDAPHCHCDTLLEVANSTGPVDA